MRQIVAFFGFCIIAICVSATGKIKPSYSSFLSGVYSGGNYAICSDHDGNTYVTYSTLNNKLKTTTGAYESVGHGQLSIYIMKIGDGGRLIWATYFGGTGDDAIYRIKTDFKGNIYMTGETSSQDFPVSPTAFQKTIYGNKYQSNIFFGKNGYKWNL